MLKTSFQMNGDYLQIFILDELYSDIIPMLQSKVLSIIEQKKPKGVLFNVAMLDIIDTYSATIIINLLKMINLIGPNPVLVGLKPEIVSYLTQSNFDFGNVLIAKHLDQGIEYLNSIKDKK